MIKKVVLMNVVKTKRIFLISPVRMMTDADRVEIAAYVRGLEADGWTVHWPERDTAQTDLVGIEICHINLCAIDVAHEVHFWHKTGSQGSIFDFGMVFALGKKIVIANPDAIQRTPHKSFENVLLAYACK